MKNPAAAHISKIGTMADRTIRLQVDCQELPPEEMAEIFRLNQAIGYFKFQESAKIDLPDDLPPIKVDKAEKSKAQRLRSVLYLLWKQTDKNMTSEEFYNVKMEQVIEMFKKQLP